MRWVAVLAVCTLACQAGAERVLAAPTQPAGPRTERERSSYAVGVEMARSFKRQAVDLDTNALMLGLREGLGGGRLRMSDSELRNALSRFLAVQKLSQAAAARDAASDNQRKGEAFLAANKARPGVVALPSGLQYRVLKAGSGPRPTDGSTVTVSYRGSLVDGTEFDSSYKRGQPATFPVNGVIRGWTEALELMPIGSKWQLFIPSELAYGPRGAGQIIGPNSTLIFEVELLAVK